ncbi:MAG: hypothetical protein QOE83_4 [Actinomycetota bacterium]|jgi:hypothetical protein|nr:hypothetical protein [Actinomycetota bacterium]
MNGCARCGMDEITTITVVAEGREAELDLCPLHLEELVSAAKPQVGLSATSRSGVGHGHGSTLGSRMPLADLDRSRRITVTAGWPSTSLAE